MSENVPRLRMFAGPNGSGKTTVKNSLGKSESWFGLYINPDDLEATIRQSGSLPLEPLGLPVTAEAVREYFSASTFLAQLGLSASADAIRPAGNSLDFRGVSFTAYHASVLSDFLRREALRAGRSFSFETVMSAGDKIDLLREAKARRYRTYLYFVATEDPAINIQRVKYRVSTGGHDVPEDKIVSRYYRSLELLKQAVPLADRAYFFDTSQEPAWFFAEITNGTTIELRSDEIPAWFQPIWDSLPEVD